jgi:Fur family transcriptional regulator, zinc uptake regulator
MTEIEQAFRLHDHAVCVEDALAAAEARCVQEGLRLTPVRRRVLELLLAEHRAMGAYEILPRLAEEGLGSQPPVVYRALDFLVGHGFAHRVERLNAFVACGGPGEEHAAAFLICRECGAVAEARLDARALPGRGLGLAAREAGFRIDSAVVEATGLCASCAAGEA